MDTDRQSTNQENDANETSQDSLFNAFCQPRTIPDHWDLTEVTGNLKQAGTNNPSSTTNNRQPDPADQVEDADTEAGHHIFYLNPIPEPRTNPIYWDRY